MNLKNPQTIKPLNLASTHRTKSMYLNSEKKLKMLAYCHKFFFKKMTAK